MNFCTFCGAELNGNNCQSCGAIFETDSKSDADCVTQIKVKNCGVGCTYPKCKEK